MTGKVLDQRLRLRTSRTWRQLARFAKALFTPTRPNVLIGVSRSGKGRLLSHGTDPTGEIRDVPLAYLSRGMADAEPLSREPDAQPRHKPLIWSIALGLALQGISLRDRP